MLSRAVKRRRTEGSSNSVQGESTGNLSTVKSVREQAEPYRICTARFPIDALTPSWTVGSNRPVDKQHVLSLCRTFEGEGLLREPQNNHLMVGCTGDQIKKMQFHCHLMNETSNWLGNLSGPWPSFDQWVTANDQKVEIISGQHRVEALKLFLQRNSKRLDISENKERWWVCDVYDLGKQGYPRWCYRVNSCLDKLPLQLKIKLRANRHDHTLLDSHAQVWLELATLAESDPTLFKGNASQVGEEMLAVLGLTEQFKFPMRRLVTLWKNNTWQPMITEWCQTAIGHSTFNVSLWAELAVHRIDDVSSPYSRHQTDVLLNNRVVLV
jgi:hypothetical protein